MKVKKKYELTSETIKFNGVTLHRIKALKDFSDVKAGDLGGWVEEEENLSQMGDSWIYSNAKVYGDAQVYGNAKVCGDAMVCGSAKVCGDTKVCDNAEVCGNVYIYGSAEVYGHAKVYDNAIVYGKAQVYDYARVFDFALVCGSAEICGNAEVYDNAKIFGDAKVEGNAIVHGDAVIRGNAIICGKADYIILKKNCSNERYFTWTRSNNMWSVGCFYGTGKELIEKAYRDSEKSGKEYEKIVRYADSILAGDKIVI